MSTPNIFSYATTERSQDAFICWLIACASEATGPLRKCGRAFVRTLFRAGASDETEDIPVVDPDSKLMAIHSGPVDVSDVENLCTQYKRIDVYFQAKVDGKKVSFIIEDKVDTEAHGDQLTEYLKAVIQDEHKEDLIKPIYFKTGHVFDDERNAVKKDRYSVFEAEDLKNFLAGHQDAIRQSQILCHYDKYLDDKIKKRAADLENWDLDQNYVQWEFMLELRDVLRGAACKWSHFVPKALSNFQHEWENSLNRDKNNRGGSPFIQYWFSTHLEWRLDAWSPLRLKIFRKNPGGSKEESDDIVYEYRKHFKKVLEQTELSGGVWGRVKDVQECTVGSIDTANFQEMTVSKFLDCVKRVHIRFLESIS